MYRIILFIFFFSFSFSLFSFQLSQNSQISVITIGPSQKELYSAFGHSGIRVKDDSLGIDYFYNYGVFDFDQPNFYINFLKGKLLYMVVRYNYKTIEDHPIKKLINLGFNISLNTDNRLMSNTSVKKEITIAKKLGINNVEELLNNSASYSFLN